MPSLIPTEIFQIIEEKPDHHYRTEVPNIICDIGLDPYQIAVYLHLKRIAGDQGACWKSLNNLIDSTGIKETKLKEVLKDLCSVNEKLGVALIKKIERKKADGSKDTNILSLTNIWAINGSHYRKPKDGGGGSPNDGGVGRQTTGGGSPNDYKEEPFKKDDDDDLRASAEKSNESEVLITHDKNGREKKSCLIAIIKYLRSFKYSDQTIKEAIERTRTHQGAISNPLRYVDSICNEIDAQNANKPTYNQKPKPREKEWKQKLQKSQPKQSSEPVDIKTLKKPCKDSKENTTDQDMSAHPFQTWPSRLKKHKPQ